MYQGVLKDEERLRQKALALLNPTAPTSTNSTPQTHTTPLNTPSSPVQQPAPVVDPDCITCTISPPPELVESQSKEQRAKERRERYLEYEAQKGLGRKLEQEQGVQSDRLV
jgi:protein PET117